MHWFDAETIRSRLPWPRVIAALAEALRVDVLAPLRAHHAIEVPGEAAATLLLMPAWRTGARLGVKLVTVFPGNSARGQAAVAAVYVLFDARDGRPLAVMDGEELTARRTAAASALAARHLARVSIWSRTRVRAETTAAACARTGLRVTACADLEGAVREADIVSCATLASAPLLHGAWLRPGTHVDLVGAFKASMRETDDEVMRRAATIVVDDRRAALAEGGDIVQAIASGAIDASRIAGELRDLACGTHPGRANAEEITVFKSVGFALEDLATANAVFEAKQADPTATAAQACSR